MKKFLYSLFILFFVFTGCKGSYSPVDSDEVKLVNVKFTNENARYVTYYQENNNLKYEVTVYDANGDFYKLYDEPLFPSYEEFLEIVKKNPEVLEMEGRQVRENEVIAPDEEELKSAYERLKSENSYYNSPYAFNIVLPEGKYTFVMEVYGTEEGYNKDVLLLKGETTAEVKQLSENREEIGSNYINIKLEEVETEIKTGNVSCYCSVNGVFESDYYFRYTTASDYEKNGNNSSWVTSKENQNLKITQTGDPKESTKLSIKLCDLQPAKYIFQFVFTFKKAGEEYVSYVSEIAEVCPGITITARFDTSTITQFGELTLYSVLTDTNTVNQSSIQKYIYCNSIYLDSPYANGYEFAGWYDDEACTKESNKVQYCCYSNQDYTYVYFDTYAALQESIKSGEYDTSYFACVNNEENRCSGDFSLYAKMVKVEPSYISNCQIIFPDGEDISTYGADFRIELIYEDNETQQISSGEYTISGNIIDIREVEIKDNTISRITLKIYNIKGRYDYSTTLNMGYGGGLQDTNISIEDDSIFGTPGTYTITSTVQDLINNNSTPSNGCVYSIETDAELRQLSDWYARGNSNTSFKVTYILLNDITVNNMSPIGYDSSYPFKGCFDGQGHTINYQNFGLFGYVGITTVEEYQSEFIPTIKNLNVEGNVNTSGKDTIGCIVNAACGPCIIDNCIANVNVTNDSSETQSYIGGICGLVTQPIVTKPEECPQKNVIIKNCINLGDFKGPINIGGIVGDAKYNVEIYNCANYGAITAGGKAGGIIGGVEVTGNETYLIKAQNCFNTGNISLTSGITDDGDMAYGALAGGCYSMSETQLQALTNAFNCCYYLSDSCSYSIAEQNPISGSITTYYDIPTIIDYLNDNILIGLLEITDCKKWNTNRISWFSKTVINMVDGEEKVTLQYYPGFVNE